jgi:UDPglucose 6-dehydrogenase
MSAVRALLRHLGDGAIVLSSSQLPVGSMGALAADFAAEASGRAVDFCCSPENLRLGSAIGVFRKPGYVVIGADSERPRARLEAIFRRFTDTILFTSLLSAEMVKHALNTFLATTITYSNEIARLCEQTGADAREVERALRCDPRVGAKAYVRAGPAFAGGTLARDVVYLTGIAAEKRAGVAAAQPHRREQQCAPALDLSAARGAVRRPARADQRSPCSASPTRPARAHCAARRRWS